MRSVSVARYALLLVVYIVVFLAVGMVPTFDYHRLLLPPADSAEVLCHLEQLDTNGELSEHTIGHTQRDSLTLYLYATVVTRTMQCVYASTEAERLTLTYRTHYLNISHVDVDRDIALLREQYARPVRRWKYNTDYVYLLRGQALDQHGLGDAPIDIYKDYWNAFLVMKFLLFIPTTVIVALLFLLGRLYARHRQTGSFFDANRGGRLQTEVGDIL